MTSLSQNEDGMIMSEEMHISMSMGMCMSTYDGPGHHAWRLQATDKAGKNLEKHNFENA